MEKPRTIASVFPSHPTRAPKHTVVRVAAVVAAVAVSVAVAVAVVVKTVEAIAMAVEVD